MTIQDKSAAPAEAPPSARDAISRAAFEIAIRLDPDRIGTGMLAELRRMEPMSGVLPSAFWRLLFETVPADLQGEEILHDRGWALLINTMALMAPRPHVVGMRPGTALAESGYAEKRLTRLLRAEGAGLEKELRAAATWLANSGAKVDCRTLARFVLARSGGFPRRFGLDADAEAHAFARDYFRAVVIHAHQ